MTQQEHAPRWAKPRALTPVKTHYDVVWPFSVPHVWGKWTEEDWMRHVLACRPKDEFGVPYPGDPFDKEAYTAWVQAGNIRKFERDWPNFTFTANADGTYTSTAAPKEKP